MAKRWTVNEDIIICKYCIENPWAYSSEMDLERIATKLESAGFSSRTKGAIKQRAYAYEVLMEGRKLSCVSNQVESIYEMIGPKNQQMIYGIKSYIREVYRPNEELETLADDNTLSNLTHKPSDALEMVRTIDYKSTFPMVLQKYVDLKGIKKHNAMCKRIGMKPDTFSAILRGKYPVVKKENVLRLCIGLELNIDQALELLNSAGYILSDAIITDVIIKAFLWNRCYYPGLVNEELKENNAPILFENLNI